MDAEEEETLARFMVALRSSESPSIPLETLYGAISHFLSTLPLDRVAEFTKLVVTSNSIQAVKGQRLLDAFSSAVFLRSDVLQSKYAKTLFGQRRRDRQINFWLKTVYQCLGELEPSPQRSSALAGILVGTGGLPDISWGQLKVEIEEEVVLSTAKLWEEDKDAAFETLAPCIHFVEHTRLCVLRLEDIQIEARRRFCKILASDPAAADDLVVPFSVFIGGFKALDQGRRERRQATWSEVRTLLADITALDASATSEDMMAVAFSSVMTISSTVLESIETRAPPQLRMPVLTTLDVASQVCIDTLLAISAFGGQAIDAMEATDSPITGLSMTVARRGGTTAVHNLFESLSSDRTSPEMGGYLLSLAKPLLGYMHGKTLRTRILPVCEQYVVRPEHQRAYASAHTFLSALFEGVTRVSTLGDRSQLDMVEELAPWYVDLAIKQAAKGELSYDQVKQALPTVFRAAYLAGSPCFERCLYVLRQIDTSDSTSFTMATKQLRISVASALGHNDLPEYLEEIAQMIEALEPRDRTVLAESVFELVTAGLPDDTKRLGYEWWYRWRNRILGNGQPNENVRARL